MEPMAVPPVQNLSYNNLSCQQPCFIYSVPPGTSHVSKYYPRMKSSAIFLYHKISPPKPTKSVACKIL